MPVTLSSLHGFGHELALPAPRAASEHLDAPTSFILSTIKNALGFGEKEPPIVPPDDPAVPPPAAVAAQWAQSAHDMAVEAASLKAFADRQLETAAAAAVEAQAAAMQAHTAQMKAEQATVATSSMACLGPVILAPAPLRLPWAEDAGSPIPHWKRRQLSAHASGLEFLSLQAGHQEWPLHGIRPSRAAYGSCDHSPPLRIDAAVAR
eukprot:gb/GFBE01040539.1/.p1 GENE.gb/GFBE01040539.1/~~gb/GFBE01040539.1/.p1  ORF type:complete len:207 (+),score=35.60 gb/GFBE01040539.1/:1-621(+)